MSLFPFCGVFVSCFLSFLFVFSFCLFFLSSLSLALFVSCFVLSLLFDATLPFYGGFKENQSAHQLRHFGVPAHISSCKTKSDGPPSTRQLRLRCQAASKGTGRWRKSSACTRHSALGTRHLFSKPRAIDRTEKTRDETRRVENTQTCFRPNRPNRPMVAT